MHHYILDYNIVCKKTRDSTEVTNKFTANYTNSTITTTI